MADQFVVFAIADTHLGLRERKPGGHRDSPTILAGFFRALNGLPKSGQDLKVWEDGSVRTRKVLPPSHIILLGDILELWDAENQSILLSSVPVGAALASVDARKIYVLGNHDNILRDLEGTYPFGLPELRLVKDVYPNPEREGPLEIGTRSFFFMHGHQLGGDTGNILGVMRQFGASLGDWAWSFLLFTGLSLYQLLISWSVLWGIVFAGSFFLWFPRFYMTYGRRIWNKATARRYKRDRALKGFRKWWKGFQRRIPDRGRPGIVYGHTHFIDWVDVETWPTHSSRPSRAERRLVRFLRKFPKRPDSLYNVSSWVWEGPYEGDLRATIFYVDEGGPLLLGWDWGEEPPRLFHIPLEFANRRRSRVPLDESDARMAQRLEWPGQLVEKLRRRKQI